MRARRLIKVIMTVLLVLLFSMALQVSINAQATIYYVDDGPLGDNANDGLSWAAPKKTIKGTIDAGATGGDEIWVKAGTYHPEEQWGIRTWGNAVAIYGGFPNTADPVWEDRDWKTNVTTIDGQNDRGHCFLILGDAIVDGFTVTRGMPDSIGLEDGGGFYIGSGSAATIRNCIIKDNGNESTTTGTGGGLLIRDNGTSPTIVNCLITGNHAWQGGAILVYGCGATGLPKLINCTISDNTTYDNNPNETGTVDIQGSNVDITNCIIYGNTLFSTNTEIDIPIGWTVNVNYSDVQQTGLGGTGNKNEDPKFVGVGDYHLDTGSPCIDAGTSDGTPLVDFEGDARWDDPDTEPNTGAGALGDYYDIGADEYTIAISPGTYYVNINRPDDSGDGTSWGTAWKWFHTATQQINNGDPGTYLLNMAAGTYSPATGEPPTELTITQNSTTIQGAGAGSTIIDEGGWTIGIQIDASNVTIKDLSVKGFSDSGITIASGTGNIIEGCRVYDNNDGIMIESGSSGTKIHNCKIYHNDTAGVCIDGSNGNQIYGNKGSIYDNGHLGYPGVGIEIENGAANNSIYDNNIYWSGDINYPQGTGILVTNAGSGNKIYQNEIHGHTGCGGCGIDVENSSPEIMQNEIYDNSPSGIWMIGQGAVSPSIWNNLIYRTEGNMYGGIYLYSGALTSSVNPTIYHNTIDRGTSYGIFIDVGAEGSANPDIKYNIITNFGIYGIRNRGGIPTIDYNDVWNNGSGTKDDNYYLCNPGPNDLYGVTPADGLGKDPLYASYELQGTSPCIDKIPIGSGDPVGLDFNGQTRNWDKDMGAYEYVADYTYNTSLPGGTGDVTDYRIYTIPVNLGTGSDLKAAMQGQLGAYNKNEWRVFGRSGASYIEMDSPGFLSLPFNPGNAFWITSFGTDALSFSGQPAPDGTYYEIPLSPGWNLFALPWLPGDPDTEDILLDNIAVERSGPFWITSPNNTLTQKCVWDYTGSGPYNGYEKLVSEYTLERGKGYWIKVLAGSAVTLLVPHDNTGNDFSGITISSFEGDRGIEASSNSEEEPPPPPGGTSNSSGFKIEAESGCFIATAAYGSTLHRYVKVLRSFRDRYLMSNVPGKKFVSLYYTYSPPVAELIADNAPLKYLTRLFLLPLIGFSAFMLYANPIFWFIGFIGFVLVTGYLILVTRNDPSIRNPASRIP